MPFFRGLLEEDRCDTTGYSLDVLSTTTTKVSGDLEHVFCFVSGRTSDGRTDGQTI